MKHRPARLLLCAALSPLLLTAGLRADSLLIASGSGNPIAYDKVKVTKVDGDTIYYRTASGTESSKSLKQVQKMQLDDEPALNAAEEAFAASKWDEAADGYLKTVKATTKPWLKDWANLRLLESASKAGRFDAAVTAYIGVIRKDPKTAIAYKPKLPEEKTTFLDTAVTEIEKTLQDPKLNDEQKQALLSFEMEIHRARKDNAKAGEVAERLSKLNPAAGGAESKQIIAETKLNLAHLALDNKEYAKVVEQIDQNAGLFTEPAQQADALFCLGEAKFALAAEDPTKLKDAGLAYMRVVAHFKSSPQAPDALLKTAQIHEKLKETEAALNLYKQVAAEYGQSPAAAKAQEAIKRLGSSAKG